MGTSEYQCFHSTTVTYFLDVCLFSPWHATVQVVPVWGCLGRVRCPLESRKLQSTQASAASFTATNLLEVACVWGHRGYGMCLLYVCVVAYKHVRLRD